MSTPEPEAAQTTTDKPWNKLKPDEKKALDPARAKKEARGGIILLVVVLLFVGGCVAVAGGDDEDKVAQMGASAEREEPAGPPTEAPKQTEAPATPTQAFEKKVRKDLGKLNRKDAKRVSSVSYTGGVAKVDLAFNDNLTENLIKVGAAGDVLDVIAAAKKLPGLKTLQVVGTFPLQNKLGQAAEERVVDVTYSAKTVQAIQVDSIERDNVFIVADVDAYIHPAFQQE